MSAPIIKFRTGYIADKIEQVECVRETAACVYFMRNTRGIRPVTEERREVKRTEYAQYHDSWAAAHAYLVERAGDNVAHCRMQLEQLNGTLGNVKGMKPPKGVL